ncbi:hypothetical protein CUC08_Gglean007160 [Alternaria sp. MG1]|nr:hypothetical protein CUC08_Gglean007160 [Alternaria sp. MG1]
MVGFFGSGAAAAAVAAEASSCSGWRKRFGIGGGVSRGMGMRFTSSSVSLLSVSLRWPSRDLLPRTPARRSLCSAPLSLLSSLLLLYCRSGLKTGALSPSAARALFTAARSFSSSCSRCRSCGRMAPLWSSSLRLSMSRCMRCGFRRASFSLRWVWRLAFCLRICFCFSAFLASWTGL